MNMLVQYDHASSALSRALNSKDVRIVLKSRDDLGLIKLRARQLSDRKLLADATEFQMRVERWLGLLLMEAQDAGHIARKGKPKKYRAAGVAPATLREIGVDAKLSMKARAAAALDQRAFDSTVAEMRTRMASGKAKLVDATNDAEKNTRKRVPHDTSRFGFLLADGKPIGRLKIGKLRSRIDQLTIEGNYIHDSLFHS